MSGAKKGLKKTFKAVTDPIAKAVKWSMDVSSKPLKKVAKTIAPDINLPQAPDAPLMPDYEMIAKDKRRRRAAKTGRSETIMSDTLG